MKKCVGAVWNLEKILPHINMFKKIIECMGKICGNIIEQVKENTETK
jgi:hypothetical protein